MNKNYLTGLLVFGFGVLTGVVIMKMMTPAQTTTASSGGMLENFVNALIKKNIQGALGQVPAWQVPEVREPHYNVGAWFSPPPSERMRAHLADNILTYL